MVDLLLFIVFSRMFSLSFSWCIKYNTSIVLLCSRDCTTCLADMIGVAVRSEKYKLRGGLMKKEKEKVTKKAPSYEIGELDQYLFGQGTHYEIYKKMGAHKVTCKGKDGVYFAVWAPHAKSVSVIGEFNNWDYTVNPMERQEPLGIYTCFISGVELGALYKYSIETQWGTRMDKADPFANYAELRPGNASRVADISHFKWGDQAWLEAREKWDNTVKPMSVYECHIGSWRRHPEGEEDETGFYNYREFAHEITKYLNKMGYTHVELMGIAEHPFDGSWGYQVTGYYAPTSRYGTPEDFAYLVDYLHKNKIGVILDWVPAHFPRDAHGLADFDGTPTFEYADPRKGEHPDWGTKIFDLGKNEVRNFLIANALFWIEHYHVDGLRVDAVASMLYLDYGKQGGQWVPNQYGGNENLEAIQFFKHLNSVVLGRNKGCMMIAEESTAWPKVTGAPEDGGLGFSLKWNMGWMHDFTEYMKLDPLFRKNAHYMMTFSMQYAYSENFILVLSHDEVVHLKCSMLNKMPGLGFDKFANLKVAYAFMIGHPGKKLLFMGQEFAQLREWSEERELDWYLLEEKPHQQIQRWFKDLLHLYKKNKALYELDTVPEGFHWINCDDVYRSVFSFERYSKNKKKNLLFVCNFTPVERPDYRVGVTRRKQYKLILDSDDKKYGGSGEERPLVYKPEKQECDGQKYSIAYPLPAYGVAVFEF